MTLETVITQIIKDFKFEEIKKYNLSNHWKSIKEFKASNLKLELHQNINSPYNLLLFLSYGSKKKYKLSFSDAEKSLNKYNHIMLKLFCYDNGLIFRVCNTH